MRLQARLVAATLAVAALISLMVPGVRAQGTGILVISQVYGAGGNTGASLRNDYVELFNRGSGTADLTGLSVQYASATGTGNFAVGAALAGTLAPGQYFLISLGGGTNGAPLPTPDATGTTNMSATAGKVVLANSPITLGCNGGSTPCTAAQLALIVDLVGYGNANFFEGAAAPTLSVANSASRRMGGCSDSNNNSLDFLTGTPAPRNSASTFTVCGMSTDPTVSVPPVTAEVLQDDAVTLTATVTPGTNPVSTFLQVTADLSLVASSGSPNQMLFDDGLGVDAVAGDNVFTTMFFVNPSLGVGAYTFELTVTDGEGRDGVNTATLTVAPPAVIYLPHDVQGAGSTSPLLSNFVVVEGVVTARKFNGFFMQTVPGSEDADPMTSEGVFVFTSTAPPAAVEVGLVVRTSGTVVEFVPSADPGSPSVTEIGLVSNVSVETFGTLPAPMTLSPAEVSSAGSFDQLERFEGMRVTAASLTAVSGTGGAKSEANATSTSDGAFYAVLTGTARPFREPGIEVLYPVFDCAASPGPCNIPIFDGNQERLRVDSNALDGTLAVDVSTGAVMTDVTGPLDYGFRTYTLLPETTLTPTGGLAPAVVPAAGADQFTVASFNMERFFDTVNDAGVSDVALTAEAYANRKNKASLLVRNVLNSPDVLGVQEVENLSTLQDLAATINLDAANAGGTSPQYVAFLEEGNDPGGIDVGFLVKTAGGRVSGATVEQVGLVATFIDPSDGSEDLLNDRPPLVLRATVHGPAPLLPQSLTVISNHLRSLNGVDDNSGTGTRVRAKRQAQAEFLANYIQGRQAADPSEAIVSLGDYNAFSFNDGYGDSMGTIRGVPSPADQAVTASADLVTPDLLDLADFSPAADRYSYVFGGNAQTLDHVLATSNLIAQFDGLAHARVNADFAEVLRNDPNSPQRLSDHDPVVVYFSMLSDLIAPVITGGSDVASEGNALGGATVAFTVPTATDNLDGNVAVTCTPASGSLFAVGVSTVTCSASDLAGNTASTQFLITVSDTVGPTLTLPSNITAQASSPSGAAVSFSASALDVVSGPLPAACAPLSGSVFVVGTTTVQCQATDGAGNTTTGSFTVAVNAAPATIAGGMKGGGVVDKRAKTTEFAFRVQETADGHDSGWLYLRVGPKHQDRLVSEHVTTVVLSQTSGSDGKRRKPTTYSVTFRGSGSWNGHEGYTFEVTATDQGKGGKGHQDTFAVVVRAPDGTVVLSSGGPLKDGDNRSLQ